MTGKKLALIFAAVTMLAVVAAALAGLSDFDLSDRARQDIAFSSGSGKIAGTLLLPAPSPAPPPVVLIVHGDGPQDRYSADGYIPLINALLDAGIGVFSWDKPGIGESEGDWRKQSMDDRASEARAAHDAVRRAAGRKVGAIGYLGFSQAGWVLPTLARDPDTDAFFVLVGGAVNWQRQGAYLTRSRLQGLDWSEDAIAAEIDRQAAAVAALDDTPDVSARIDAAARLFGISHERAGFVLRNRDADATEALRKAGAPFLALWGEDDLNVDAATNAEDYARLLLPNHPANRVEIIPGATHGLLHSWLFNYQLPQDMPWWARAAFVALGRHAYATDGIATIAGWIDETTR
jgi:alpha-beta hydrolase superfamily lysophospholipase